MTIAADSIAPGGQNHLNSSLPTSDSLECLFYSEAEAASLLGIHRTTLRTLALEGRAPVAPIQITEHRRIYRRVDIHRLAGLEP